MKFDIDFYVDIFKRELFKDAYLKREDFLHLFDEIEKNNPEGYRNDLKCIGDIIEAYTNLFVKDKGSIKILDSWSQFFKSFEKDLYRYHFCNKFNDQFNLDTFRFLIFHILEESAKPIEPKEIYKELVSSKSEEQKGNCKMKPNTVNKICPKIIKKPRLEESKDLHKLKLSFYTRISGMLYIGDSVLPIKNMKLFHIIFMLQNWIRYNPRAAMFTFSKPTKDASSNLIRFSGNIKQYNVNINIGFDSARYDNTWKCMASNMDGTKYGIVFSGNFSSSSNVIPTINIFYEPESDIYINLGVETVISSIIIGASFESNIDKAEFDEFLNKLVTANNIKNIDADEVMYGGKALQKTFNNITIKSDYVPTARNTHDIEYEIVWSNLSSDEASYLYSYFTENLLTPPESYKCNIGYHGITLRAKNISYINLNLILLDKKIKKYNREVNMYIYINVR